MGCCAAVHMVDDTGDISRFPRHSSDLSHWITGGDSEGLLASFCPPPLLFLSAQLWPTLPSRNPQWSLSSLNGGIRRCKHRRPTQELMNKLDEDTNGQGVSQTLYSTGETFLQRKIKEHKQMCQPARSRQASP